MSSLELHEVHCHFGAIEVLKGITLDVSSGERHVLIGPSGAGKSTLLDTIAGAATVSSGEIKLDGRDVGSLPEYRRARMGLSHASRHCEVTDGVTVGRNLDIAASAANFSIGMPWEAENGRKLMVCKQMRLERLLTSRVSNLSLSGRRQVEIAMALLVGGTVLLLDEPTDGLTPAERLKIMELLSDLPRTITILMAERNISVAMSIADRVSVLKEGKIGRTIEGSRDFNERWRSKQS